MTARWLVEQEACESAVIRFRAAFPRGVILTRKRLLVAAREGWAVAWLASQWPLSAEARPDLVTALVLAWGAYGEAMEPVRRAFSEAMTWHSYTPIMMATACRAFDQAAAAVWRTYNEAAAAAFADTLGLP